MKYKTAEEYLRDWPAGVSGSKGEGHASDQLKLQNQLTQQQLSRQNSMQDTATGGVRKYLEGSGEGFDPAMLAAALAQFRNSNSDSFNQAGSQVRSMLGAKGDSGLMPTGGDYVRGISGLYGAQAGNLSSGILGMNVQNLQQALANRFNAANVFTGNAAQAGNTVGIFNQGASNALNQYMNASNSGFGATFMRGLGGSLGQAVGSMASAGLGGALGGGKSNGGGGFTPGPGNDYSLCWVARAVYGDNSWQWLAFRDKFFSTIGPMQVLYLIFGKPFAKVVKRSAWLKAKLRRLMDKVIYA